MALVLRRIWAMSSFGESPWFSGKPNKTGASVRLGVMTSNIAHDSGGNFTAGAGFRTIRQPSSRPIFSDASTAGSASSIDTTSTSAPAICGRKPSTCCGVNSSSAPAATMILFSPSASTKINPTMVCPLPVTTHESSTPSSFQSARAPCPKSSGPIAVRKLTSAPSLAAPIA